MALLITGGTGFLGRHLVSNLLQSNRDIFLLVRRESYQKAENLYKNNPKIHLILGDILNPKVVESSTTRQRLISETTSIIHAACYSNIKGNYEKCFSKNVGGTKNIIQLAKHMRKLKFFHYLSSIAVSGDFMGELREDVLDIGQKFSNYYAQTRFDAELCVRNWTCPSVAKRVYRLGVLVGDSMKGMTTQKDGPYYFFGLLNKLQRKKLLLNTLKYLPVPFEKSSVIPMIPVDHAAKFVTEGVLKPSQSLDLRCYHVVSKGCPTVGQFVQDSFDEFGFSVNVVPLPKSKANNLIMDKVGLPKEFLPYTYSKCKYDQSMARKDFPELDESQYGNYKNAMFSFVKGKL
ncbi:MAG: hypothetical protein CME68_03870 [Halobacteriovoraceae bacterium]|nr:hypothetical protein [Halobacteriovoraceae bacterium]